MGIYLDGFLLGAKIKLGDECTYTREGPALFWGIYGILWFADFDEGLYIL